MIRILVERDGQREIREIPQLLTVGRGPDCTVVVASQEIAAVQARIDHVSGRYLLTNLGKTGRVLVNGAAVDTKRTVELHDEIEIGEVRLTLMAEEMADPHGDISSIRLRCCCGAVLKVASRYVGKVKHCPKCQVAFTVPTQDDTTPAVTSVIQYMATTVDGQVPLVSSTPDPRPMPIEAICPVCQCSILADEEQTSCCACGLPHHSDCWNDNRGCSAYGCTQVGALKNGPDIRVLPEGLGSPLGISTPPLAPLPVDGSVPWEFALLGLSALVFLVGTFTYGVPCFLGGALIAAFVISREGRVNWAVLAFAGLTCLIGFVAGIVISIQVYAA